ncbi:hypothetical protein [Subsaximicrobium wynnwilliamsii]|nr:hypothetical protein [Subsaximicrobium wynnwilliamsii]
MVNYINYAIPLEAGLKAWLFSFRSAMSLALYFSREQMKDQIKES